MLLDRPNRPARTLARLQRSECSAAEERDGYRARRQEGSVGSHLPQTDSVGDKENKQD